MSEKSKLKIEKVNILSRYTFSVVGKSTARQEFKLSFQTDNPDSVNENAMKILASNTSNPDAYALRLASIEVLSDLE